MEKTGTTMKIWMCLLVILSANPALAETRLTTKARENWLRCAKTSYEVQKDRISDKNLAAEYGLQACKTEEAAFIAASSMPDALFALIKSDVKSFLIKNVK
jgi:hypothetical protein